MGTHTNTYCVAFVKEPAPQEHKAIKSPFKNVKGPQHSVAPVPTARPSQKQEKKP